MQEFTSEQLRATDRFVSSLPTTTDALHAIGKWLDECGDPTGAAMLARFAVEFEVHENTQL